MTVWNLEKPFGWGKNAYQIEPSTLASMFPDNKPKTISFQATTLSKFLAVFPVVGFFRLNEAIKEYRHFHNLGIDSLRDRSMQWIVRGALESVPCLGGVICIIIDILATLFACCRNSGDIILIQDKKAQPTEQENLARLEQETARKAEEAQKAALRREQFYAAAQQKDARLRAAKKEQENHHLHRIVNQLEQLRREARTAYAQNTSRLAEYGQSGPFFS